MAIERRRVARHILVPDTNILWHSDKANCVDPEFQEFWDRNATTYEIDLVLSYVVLEELRFQQTTSATKALSRANAEFDKMSSVASSSYSHRISEKKIQRDVKNKLDAWAQRTAAAVHAVPVDSIDWNRVVEDAVWRNPPFVEDKATEKGFRDAVIIETAVDIANSNPNVNLAFLSSDKLVLDAARKRLAAHCSCYETVEEFDTFLKLTDEELTNDFVKAIQVKARAKFHSETDTSLIYTEGLVAKFREQFPGVFTPPSEGSALGIGGLLESKGRWEPATSESIWILAPQFSRLEGDNDFFWSSKFLFVQLFKFTGQSTGGLLGGAAVSGDEKLRKIEVPVKWKARVAKNGRFLSTSFEEFEDPETIFEPITDSERQRYGINPSIAEQSS